MNDESRAIAAEAIPGVAAAMQSRHQAFAAVYGFLAIIVVIASVGMAAQPRGPHHDLSTAVIGGGSWFMAFLLGVVRRIRSVRRAKHAAREAGAFTWHLAGRELVPAAASGAPRIDLAFKITPGLRRTLLAVPRATVVQ